MPDAVMREEILEPDLPIVDPHHHLWDRRNYATPAAPTHPFITAIADAQRYLLDDLLADTGSGHNITATVYLEWLSMYRKDGPPEMQPVGEIKFANGVEIGGKEVVNGAPLGGGLPFKCRANGPVWLEYLITWRLLCRRVQEATVS